MERTHGGQGGAANENWPNQPATAGYAPLRHGKGRSSPLPGRRKFSPGSGKQIQIGASKHRVQAVLIFPEPAVDGFAISKLTFYDAENMLHLAAYSGLEILDMSFPVKRPIRYAGEGAGTAADAEINAGKMRVTGHFGPFLNTQISRALICSYHKEDFSESSLFHELNEYQTTYRLNILCQ